MNERIPPRRRRRPRQRDRARHYPEEPVSQGQRLTRRRREPFDHSPRVYDLSIYSPNPGEPNA